LIPRENPLVAACYAAWHKGAGGWEDIEDELAAVKMKDVEELLKALAGLSEGEVNDEVVYLAAFCYEAAAEPLGAREELVRHAGLLLQRLFIRRAGPPAPLEVLPPIIDAAERLHCRLAQILRRLGKPEAAQAHFEKAECLLTKSAEETMAEEHVSLLCGVLARSSELAEERGDYPQAERKIRAAIGLADHQRGHEWERSDLLGSLVRVVRTQKGEDAAKELLDEILRDRGTRTAALAGHEGAEEVASVEWDNLGSFVRPSFEEGKEGEERLSSAGRLVQLLNLRPELVERKVEEVAGEEAAEATHKGPVSLPGMTRVGDLHRQWQRWRAVQVLQRMADIAVSTSNDTQDGRVLVEEREGILSDKSIWIRFRGFTIEDVEVLCGVEDRAQQASDIGFMAGALGEDSGIFNYALPEHDYYCGPLPQSHPVDLIVLRSFVGGADTKAMDLWIADGLRMLTDALAHGEPDLRRCEMPRGVTCYLDYLLGEKDEPPPKCGKFFIATRQHKETCGHPTCETYHGRLQPLESRACIWRHEQHLHCASLSRHLKGRERVTGSDTLGEAEE